LAEDEEGTLSFVRIITIFDEEDWNITMRRLFNSNSKEEDKKSIIYKYVTGKKEV
jgi:hypothetical protein